ncbi:MAG: hypothetical protein Q8N63_04370 [Nanoarchaeota archaeon]|nr:hypothetical protein [Nanoarchaeota archaeon]
MGLTYLLNDGMELIRDVYDMFFGETRNNLPIKKTDAYYWRTKRKELCLKERAAFSLEKAVFSLIDLVDNILDI